MNIQSVVLLTVAISLGVEIASAQPPLSLPSGANAGQERMNADFGPQGPPFFIPRALRVKVVDEATGKPVPDAVAIIGRQVRQTSQEGTTRLFGPIGERVTVTVAYIAGRVKRLVTFHNVPVGTSGNRRVGQGELLLPVPNGLPLRREAKFFLDVPFGGVPAGSIWTGLLPQLATDLVGPRFGAFEGIELFEDKVQDDGLASLMVVAFDEDGLPFKYGHMLDKAPGSLDRKFLFLVEPFATPLELDVAPVSWAKRADPINDSSADDECDFQAPPYTQCGFFFPLDGIFSWINVIRKGIVYTTPGVFLPARTAGANPLMQLPDAVIEMVGHDDPLGIGGGINYNRHKFNRFELMPMEVEIVMPNVLIGTADQTGAEAISVMETNGSIQLSWNVGAGNGDLSHAQAVDYATLELIWPIAGDGTNAIWLHVIESMVGFNKLSLPVLPRRFSTWVPPSADVFSDTTVSLFGTNGVEGFEGAWAAWQAGQKPIRLGDQAFDVNRWR